MFVLVVTLSMFDALVLCTPLVTIVVVSIAVLHLLVPPVVHV
jgi:hypothetical protein